jgi:FtsP/CotA-like multicopper oxidase with cupredoxin domain
MYVKHAAAPATLTPAGIHLVPYDEAALDTTIAENAEAPLLGPSTSLEYFGNMPVVNGVVYGKYDVDRKLYRMRFLGGTDSRTWILQLNSKVRGATTVSPTPIPFYVIGSEQGFLNHPVARTQIVLMPGERIDVLVDFRMVPAGDNQVILANYGTDGPYQGIDNTTLSTVQSVDIPEIMAFDVSNVTDALLTTSTAPTTNLRILVPPVAALPAGGGLAAPFPTLTPTSNVRVIALEEIVDQYGRIMPTIDRRGYLTTGIPATEVVMQNTVEEWDIINTTADDHPMHLHQVAFQVVSRTPFDLAGFFKDNTAAVNDLVNNVFLPPTYVAIGPPIPPGEFENGWKDTVFTPPGYVTKVRAKFDLVGEYVWHCHILSHEEHDMMRPMVIVNLTANVPSSFTVPAAATGTRTAVVTIGAPVAQPAIPAYKYVIEYTQTNSATPDTWHPVYSIGLTPTITFPRDGVYSLRVKAVDAAIIPAGADSAWVTAPTTITVAPATDAITNPLNAATLTASTQIFTFTSSSPLYPHTLWVGTTPGGSELGKFKAAAGITTITATDLPTTGVPLYVRLIVTIPAAGATPAVNRYNDYTYTAFTGAPPPALTPTATAATAVTSTGFTANWTAVAGATGYFLDVSTSSAFTSFITGYNGRNVGNVTTLALTGLNTVSKSYYYRVRAHNGTLTSVSSNVISLLAKNHHPDFDGDGKADLAVWTPATGLWSITPSYTGIAPYTFAWGVSTDKLVPGDFDGDGKTDIAVYRASVGDWFIVNSSTGTTSAVQWGMTGDIPVPGDFDGDGKTDIAVYRPSVGAWFIKNSATGTTRSVQWGNATDIPVPGDYDGDGKTDIAVWRASAGNWYIIDSSTNVGRSVAWGMTGDTPVPADYDGDGKTDIAVWRPSTGTWHIIDSSTGLPRAVQWGMSTDKPVPADYDGDGKADIAVWRPATATGYIIDSATATQRAVIWGTPTDLPVVMGLPIP